MADVDDARAYGSPLALAYPVQGQGIGVTAEPESAARVVPSLCQRSGRSSASSPVQSPRLSMLAHLLDPVVAPPASTGST